MADVPGRRAPGHDAVMERLPYSYLQLWVVVPLLLAVLALRQRARVSGQVADNPCPLLLWARNLGS